jgi:hypothetical protein
MRYKIHERFVHAFQSRLPWSQGDYADVREQDAVALAQASERPRLSIDSTSVDPGYSRPQMIEENL